jgi:1-acyl-sn-glycerol-3-phosphate acyltransferase
MDRKIRNGLKFLWIFFYSAIIITWTIFSAALDGWLALCAGIFSGSWARSIARAWCIHIIWITGSKLSVEGLENIDRSKHYVFVANHQSYFDIPALYAGIGSSISFIAKKELFGIPFFGWGMWAIGCIKIDRKNPRKARESLSKGVAALKKNNISLVIFPEGTRSLSGKVGEFKRASFTLAIEAGVPVVPVAISGTRDIQKKSSLQISSATVHIVIGKPIPADEYLKTGKEGLAEKARETIIKILDKKINTIAELL